MRPNISLGDSLAGLHAAFGAVMALLHRSRAGGQGQGQVRKPSLFVLGLLLLWETLLMGWVPLDL